MVEQRIEAAYATAWFTFQHKGLGPKQLKQMMPVRQRNVPTADRAAEQAIAARDSWAKGINRRVAKQQAAKC